MRQSQSSNFSYRLARVGQNSIRGQQKQSKGSSNHYRRKSTRINPTSSVTINDSLQNFQMQIDSMINKKIQQTSYLKQRKNKVNVSKRNKTQQFIPQRKQQNQELQSLKGQIQSVKKSFQKQQQSKNGMQSKFQQLLMKMALRNNMNQSRHNNPPPPPPQHHLLPQIIYPPQYPPYPYYPSYSSKRRNNYSDDSQQEEPRRKDVFKKRKATTYPDKKQRKNRLIEKLRKAFYAVTFISFLKGQAKKLTKIRKNNLRSFWLEKFEGQINNIKNFLLQSHKYTFSIILQKKNLELSYQGQKRSNVKKQKMKLAMQLLQISTKQLLKQSTTQKISVFAQGLQTLCKRGSFMISRFWTAYQMQMVCISQYYGYMRIDENGQKCLIIILVFIKILIYNMLLQPHKFDSINFKKKTQPLYKNMHFFSSIYYHLSRNLISEYMLKRSDQSQYKYGNWLQVKKQFIVECTQPMVYGNDTPELDQYISGLTEWETIKQIRQKFTDEWQKCKQMMKQSVQKMHCVMIEKGKLMKKNLKYKVYN